MNAPAPPPAATSWPSATVGFGFTLQTTPRSVTRVVPCSVTVPPPLAPPAVMPETSAVVTFGRLGSIRRPSAPVAWKSPMLALVVLVAVTQ